MFFTWWALSPTVAGWSKPSARAVNGDVEQRGYTRDMSFSIPHILSLVSEVMTLEVGDLLATGDVGCDHYLKPGDMMETEIEGLGVLRNPVELE